MTSKTNLQVKNRNAQIRGHELFVAKLYDKLELVDRTKSPVLTSFLTPEERRIVETIASKKYVVSFYGGYEEASRVIAWISADQREPDFDYAIVSSNYQTKISHKDVLGALMHLGIERNQIGDIEVQEDRIYLVCKESMADFICSQLRNIRNSQVYFNLDYNAHFMGQRTEEVIVHCASLRMDAIVACLSHCSRAKAIEKIKAGQVKLNDVLLEENEQLCNNDVVSIRRCGRFKFSRIVAQSKKGRLVLAFEQYI